MSIEPEFDCMDCMIHAEEAAENAMLGWAGIVDYYREFREHCRDGFPIACPACGDEGTYWEDRVPVHDSVVGFEIRSAGIEHADGRLCTEW